VGFHHDRIGGRLVWEYPFWNRSFGGIWLIFVLGPKKRSKQIPAAALIYLVPILMNVVARSRLGWRY
jgi:hypothetical protein